MAHFVRNASKIAYKRIKMFFFYRKICQNLIVEKISATIIKFFYTMAWFIYLKCA
jgi:hypothetical protein